MYAGIARVRETWNRDRGLVGQHRGAGSATRRIEGEAF